MKYKEWIKYTVRNLKDMAPAFILLLLTALFFFVFGDWDHADGCLALYRTLFRFVKLSLFSCLSLLCLIPIYKFLIQKLNNSILLVKEKRLGRIRPIKHWFFRPFQGIGIGLLFGTKLLALLQIVAGTPTESSSYFFLNQFQLNKLIVIFIIMFLVSLILSVFWTLDDMGIRYYNPQDQELKMIGKYTGTLMPLLFGSYGILSLFASFPKWQAIIYLGRVIIVLYSPFAFFTVLHYHFVRTKIHLFSYGNPQQGGIFIKKENNL
jgi:hypothetical protein